MNFAAVEGLTIQAVAPITGGSFAVITQPSQKVKASKKGVYSGEIQVQVSATQLGAYVQSGSTTITIRPNLVTKAKAEGDLMFTVGDNGTTTEPQTFVLKDSSIASAITIQIVDAGQNKVRVS